MSTLNQSRNGPATVQLREAHPGPAHARAGVSQPARESPHRIGPRRPLVVVAVAVVVGLVAFAVWRLFLAPPAVAPGVIAVSGRIEGDVGPGGYGASVRERAGGRARGPASPEQRTWHARRSSERLGFVARTHRESSGTGHTRICRSLGRGRRAGFGESGYSLGDDHGRARS